MSYINFQSQGKIVLKGMFDAEKYQLQAHDLNISQCVFAQNLAANNIHCFKREFMNT